MIYFSVSYMGEHFWIQSIEITDEHIYGIVCNNPYMSNIRMRDIVCVDKNTRTVISWFEKKF